MKYDSYIDSGITVLGKVPSQWLKSKFKFQHQEFDLRVGEDSDNFQLLSLTKKGVIIRDINSGKGKFPESFDTYKIVHKGDIIFCLYDIEETPRTVGLSETDGMISGSYKIFKTKGVIPKFTYYTFLVIDDVKGLKPYYTGLRNVVRPETFNSLPFFVPPLQEQKQIVDFLNTKTSLIDSLIEKTQRKIELLKEKRTSLINHVVTKGLNPNIELKDSGVEWIGEIPNSWSRKKIKHISIIISKGTTPSTIGRELIDTGEVKYLKSENIVNNQVVENPKFFIDIETNELLGRSQLIEGDILFVIAGASLGKVAILGSEFVPANTNQAVSFIRLKQEENIKFIWYWLTSSHIEEQIWIDAVQSAQPNLSMEDLGNFFIPYPNFDEQQQIVEYLDKKTNLIDTTIFKEQKRVELLKEYRQSLISEVVTGKIKVCN